MLGGMIRTCSVSIDVDPIPCYYRIHALGPAPVALRSRILCASLPRFANILDSRDIKATFFIVAEDIDIEALGAGDLYISRFQAPDAHEEFDADPAAALRKAFFAYDGATPDGRQSTGFSACCCR